MELDHIRMALLVYNVRYALSLISTLLESRTSVKL